MPKKKGIDPNSPFAALGGMRDELATAEKAQAEAERLRRIEREKTERKAREETDLWLEATTGVKRIGGDPALPLKKKKPEGPLQTHADEDEEVLRELSRMVDGRAPLDFNFSDEFVEGRAQDCSKLELGRLKSGELSVQAHLDLHGLNRDEARRAIGEFFSAQMTRGHRCVLVICGRGLHTPGGKPVLKELLVRWLAQGSLSHGVLAFCSAKAHDGGVGALYVLLRRHKRG